MRPSHGPQPLPFCLSFGGFLSLLAHFPPHLESNVRSIESGTVVSLIKRIISFQGLFISDLTDFSCAVQDEVPGPQVFVPGGRGRHGGRHLHVQQRDKGSLLQHGSLRATARVRALCGQCQVGDAPVPL